MKKILAILALLVFLPFSAFALNVLHDDALDQITGREGITIETDLTIDVTMDTVVWIDMDGVSTYTGPGFLTLLNTTIGTITVVTGTPGMGIAIDVGSDLNDVYYTSGPMALGAGLPFLRIGITDLDVTIGNITTDFSGPIDILGVGISGINGYIDIGGIAGYEDPTSSGSVNSVGLEINLGLAIDSVSVGQVTWTDNDGKRLDNPGLGAADDTDNQGVVGITGLALGNLGVTGQITIECATDTVNRPAGSETFLEIELNSLGITMDNIAITLALGTSINDLNQVMGTLSVGGASGLAIGIDGMVNISAH